MYNGTTPRVRTLANYIESLIDTVNDVIQTEPASGDYYSESSLVAIV
jgi:hypothetical protein